MKCYQAVTAAIAFAFAQASDDDEQKNGNFVIAASMSTTPNDDEDSSNLFLKSCMLCNAAGTNIPIDRSISRGLNLRGGAGNFCVFDASVVSKNSFACCNDSETGEPWEINDLTAFLVTDPLLSVKREDASAVAMMLKDICSDI